MINFTQKVQLARPPALSKEQEPPDGGEIYRGSPSSQAPGRRRLCPKMEGVESQKPPRGRAHGKKRTGAGCARGKFNSAVAAVILNTPFGTGARAMGPPSCLPVPLPPWQAARMTDRYGTLHEAAAGRHIPEIIKIRSVIWPKNERTNGTKEKGAGQFPEIVAATCGRNR